MNALNVGKPLARGHTLLHIRKFTLERNPISAVNVGKPSGSIHSSFSIREFIVVRNLINVRNVGKPSSGAQLFSNIRDFVLEKNLNVRKHSARICCLEKSSEFSKRRKLISVTSVVELSMAAQTSSDIR